MKRLIIRRLLFTFFVVSPFFSHAQGWQHLFPTDGSGHALLQSSDGNIIFLGEDKVSGWPEAPRLHKTDLDGNVIWSQTYPQLINSSVGNLVEMPNGELIVVGDKNFGSANGQSDIFMLFTDAMGNQIDINYIGDDENEYGNDIIQDADGNLFVIGGTSGSGNGLIDAFVIKFNPSGAIVWEKTFGFAGYDMGNTAEVLPNGDLMVLGWTQEVPGGPSDLYLIRIDTDGNEVFSKIDYGTRDGDITPTADGNFFLATTTPGQLNQPDVMVVKLDPSGNELWSETYVLPDMQAPNSIELTTDGGFIVGGRTNSSGAGVILFKGDANGNLEFEKKITVGQLDWAEDIVQLSDGGYAFCGRGNIGFTRMFIGRTDNQGSIFSNEITGRIVLDGDDDCILDSAPNGQSWKVELLGENDFSTYSNANGEFQMIVDTGDYQVVITPVWPTNPNTVEQCGPIADLDLNDFYETTDLGDILFKNIQGPTETISGYVFYDTNGNCEFDAGETPVECVTVPFSPEGQFDTNFSAETDADGYYEIQVPIGDYYYPGGGFGWNNLWNCSLGTCNIDGGFVTTGQPMTVDIPLACTPDVEVIAGTVYLDDNEDCLYDTLSETALYDWNLALVNTTTNDTTYTSTLSNGVYNFLLGSGTYEVFVLLPNATWETCTNPHIVTVGNGCHTGFDFPIQPAEVCPLLEVDISTNVLRPCFQSTYFVQYCNIGSETATDAFIEVILDNALEFVDSPFPVTQDGQVLTFDIGDVEPLECQTLNFNVFLDCDAMVGMTHCVEAHIFPDTTCVPVNPLWDMSSIKLTGYCDGDSLTFTIENIGTGDMSQQHEYIVIEDNVLIRSEPFQLPSGSQVSETFFPEGATLRMETEQSAFHPGNSMPSVTLEGCGTNSSGGISTGFVIQMPEDDLNPFISIECLESVNSFDPNDKQGFPTGIGTGHFIQPNTALDYKIRFQNTGTAPALNVEIRDTLSNFLDPNSLRPGVSSHDYEFELENGNIAVFRFEGINLPDSTSSPEESMGFVKFKIEQTPDNPSGTQILNDAAIYFDFNPPIITNETEHQIPFPIEEQNITEEVCLGEEWMGTIITGDISFTETTEYAFFEEVVTIEIIALDHSFFEQNITLMEGQTFNGIAITSDTTIIENLTASNGCDSTATTHISILPNSVSETISGLSATVFPNPATSVFFVEMELAESMELELALTDVLGRNMSQGFESRIFKPGMHRLDIPVDDLPFGTYLLQIKGEAGTHMERILVRE